jgi:sugar-specific transcriptional regulator TrmB
MNIEKTLKWLGLSNNESKIYLVMLKRGTSKAGKIARFAQLNRTSTYSAINSLLDKGLASYVIRENRKWFTAVEPKRLIEFLKEKVESAEKIMPELEKQYNEPKEDHNVTLYNGYKGVKTLFMDMLKVNKDIYVLDSEVKFGEVMKYFVPQYKRAVERQGIKIKHIVRTGVDVNPTKTTVTKYLDLKTKSPASTTIYGDKIALIIWSKRPEAVLIKNRLAAEIYKEYFEILWKQGN